MTLKTKLATVATAAVILAASAAAALASPAVISHTTPVYSNLGWGQVGTALAGQYVNVGSCQNGYCYVQRQGNDGWVKSWAISWNNGYPHGGYPHGGYPGWGNGYGYGYGGDNFHFCAGGPGAHFCIAD